MKKLVVLLALGFACGAFAGERTHFTYDEFIRQVEADKIKSASLDSHSKITGTLASGETFRSFGKTGTSNDPLLTKLLGDHGVEVDICDAAHPNIKGPMLMGLLFMSIPVLALVVALSFLLVLVRMNRKLNQLLKEKFEA